MDSIRRLISDLSLLALTPKKTARTLTPLWAEETRQTVARIWPQPVYAEDRGCCCDSGMYDEIDIYGIPNRLFIPAKAMAEAEQDPALLHGGKNCAAPPVFWIIPGQPSSP